MKRRKKYPYLLIYSVAAMIILAFLAALVVDSANRSRSYIPAWGTAPEFEFRAAHNGQPFGLEQLKGKLSVIDFIFTRCKGPCPIMTPNMAKLYDLYKGSDKVQFVSITVDPDYDSPSVLQKYAEDYGVTDDRWVFLRGPIDKVARLCEGGFMLAADDLPGGHTTKFILVDQQGQIRSYHNGVDDNSLSVLQTNIKQLAKEMP